MNENQAYPLISTLYNGLILRTIAHAVWIVSNPILAYSYWWEDSSFLINNSSGIRGAITFDDKHEQVVGVFFDEESENSPYP